MGMNSVPRVEVEDIVFFEEHQYSFAKKRKYLETFTLMVVDGRLKGGFTDDHWIGFTGIKRVGIYFSMCKETYNRHMGKQYGIPYEKMVDMLKCYALSIMSDNIYVTIRIKIDWIKQWATTMCDSRCSLPDEAQFTICDFLCFIGTPDDDLQAALSRIHFHSTRKNNCRELSNLINYLVIANEINDMFRSSMPDDEFIKWFPIFFWTNVTFIIPLRATEMIVTPFDCITRENGKVSISVRRTTLKGGRKTVYHSVERDYKLFTYVIPDNWIVETIEKYQQLTDDHDRKYLFDYPGYSPNEMFRTEAFNQLLSSFIHTHLIGNSKYDYAKFAAGIDEFEIVTAGDSRPIAMANLFFQDISADICRQLANHSQVSTSFGYYTNISNTIHCTSIMRIQKQINRRRAAHEDAEAELSRVRLRNSNRTVSSYCCSPYQPMITGNVSDCIAEKHLQECLGCRFYCPSESELRGELEKRKQKLNEISQQFMQYIAKQRNDQEVRENSDKLFLDVHTGAIRLKTASDEYAKEAEYRWRRHKNTQKTCY